MQVVIVWNNQIEWLIDWLLYVCQWTANAEQIEKAKELIKKLQFAFRSESFENPILQHHYASVEAMALDRDTVEEISDFTRALHVTVYIQVLRMLSKEVNFEGRKMIDMQFCVWTGIVADLLI